MRITYSRSVDAAYIYLVPSIHAGEVAHTYPCDPATIGYMINLDFDVSWRLLGIEVLDASKHLPQDILKGAEPME